jgi:hypothetical protein
MKRAVGKDYLSLVRGRAPRRGGRRRSNRSLLGRRCPRVHPRCDRRRRAGSDRRGDPFRARVRGWGDDGAFRFGLVASAPSALLRVLRFAGVSESLVASSPIASFGCLVLLTPREASARTAEAEPIPHRPCALYVRCTRCRTLPSRAETVDCRGLPSFPTASMRRRRIRTVSMLQCKLLAAWKP